MTDTTAQFLEHFGVKGMKWGVRRNRTSAPASSDSANASAVRAKIKESGGIHTLSNKELRDFLDRADLERRYKQATADDPSLKKGHSYIKSILAFGQTANNAYNLYNSPLSKEIRKAIENKRG